MKVLLALLIFLYLPIMSLAQETKPQKDYKGFYVGFSLMSSNWTMPDADDIEPSGGFGVGGTIGYSFGPHFGIVAPISISSFNPSEGAGYQMYDMAIGGELRLGKASSTVKPFARLTYGSMWLYSDLSTGDVTIVSYGTGLDTGLQFDLSRELNLKLGYRHYWGNISSVLIGSEEYDADGNIDTSQFSVGLVRYF